MRGTYSSEAEAAFCSLLSTFFLKGKGGKEEEEEEALGLNLAKEDKRLFCRLLFLPSETVYEAEGGGGQDTLRQIEAKKRSGESIGVRI